MLHFTWERPDEDVVKRRGKNDRIKTPEKLNHVGKNRSDGFRDIPENLPPLIKLLLYKTLIAVENLCGGIMRRRRTNGRRP